MANKFTIIASKTFPSDPNYSPAYIDEAETLDDAIAKYSTVSDYPCAFIEYTDATGRVWELQGWCKRGV